MNILEMVNLIKSINENDNNPYYVQVSFGHSIILIVFGEQSHVFRTNEKGIAELMDTLYYIDAVR